ncbi:zonular occludens toxin Zot [Sulfuritortus calidifontis]|uniref:Zonular occludens toxin Zot n=1 Tax=Sulfuritortus calidifontis TaxID=1914471 RepID=A0A4R3JVV1_9PROT|nr:zonular occludens toxin domain-containing protein [Sulfuritortus calidifontis]TCS72156.1 zonular occludens toxin Zot [Sulfuritortus calidifontis]
MATIVGATGSPNTVNDVSFDVRAGHLNTALLGALVAFDVRVRIDDVTEDRYLVLGQVSSIETINRWHEEAALKNFIKLRGRLPHLTEVGDITEGKIQVIGAYRVTANGYMKARIAVPPGSGIDVAMVEARQVLDLVQHERGYAFIGKFYGSRDVPAPAYLKHFGDAKQGGSGEAYMGGVFGPSGSGKTVMAMAITSLWTAASQDMGFLLLDPQSEFAENKIGGGTGFSFDLHGLLRHFSGGRFDPARDVVRLDQIQLEGENLFAKMLDSADSQSFFYRLGVKNKRADAIDAMENLLDEMSVVTGWSLTLNFSQAMAVTHPNGDTFEQVLLQVMANLYAGRTRQDKLTEFTTNFTTRKRQLESCWNKVTSLFAATMPNGGAKVKLLDIVRGPLSRGQIKILDLNPNRLDLDEDYKIVLMNLVFKRISQYAHMHFKSGKNLANCMIVIDEAGRFIPQSPEEDEEKRQLVKDLVAKVKMLRKYQVGFMFITQTIAEIQKEIFRNLHYRVYGVGLGVGADREHIVAKEGQAAFDLYQALPDPRQSATYSYMVAGILPVLGSSGRPMFIEGYGSDTDIISANSGLNGGSGSSGQAGSPRTIASDANTPPEDDFDVLDLV